MAKTERLIGKYYWQILFLTFLLSFIVRVVLIFWRQTYVADYGRTDIGGIPYNLVNGLGYTYLGMPSSYFGPGYTYVWAVAMLLFGREGGQLGVQLLQAVLLSLAPWPLFYFARHAFGTAVALVSATWMAFYPELLVLSSTMYSDSLAVFLWCAVLGLYAALVGKKRPSTWLAILLGATLGLLALTKGRMLAFAAVVLLALLVNGLRAVWPTRALLSRRVLLPILAGLVMLLAILPWTARNYAVHDTFMPLESTMGFNLWLGHNPAATGTGKARLGNTAVAGGEFDETAGEGAAFPVPAALEAALATCQTEVTCDELYQADALAFIRANPERVIELSGYKALYAWWFDPTSAAARSILYRVPWVVTLVFFALGALHRLFVARRVDWLMWAILLVSTLLQMLFFVVPRLRYPVYPIVFVFAGYGAWLLARAVLARYADPRPAPVGS